MAKNKLNPSQIAVQAAQSYVVTDQTTTSTSYADLSTVQSVTITVGGNGMALVSWSCGIYTTAAQKRVSVAISGATTTAASDDWSIRKEDATFTMMQSMTKLFTGLTPGSTTFTLKFKVGSGTGNFFERTISAVAL